MRRLEAWELIVRGPHNSSLTGYLGLAQIAVCGLSTP
jgi:hypothetical protein